MFQMFFLFILFITTLGMSMQPQIIIWDNHGTISGAKNPQDSHIAARTILPNVKHIMHQNLINIICSGTKTDREEHSWDPKAVMAQLEPLMDMLPISITTFSPAIGGVECWVMIKHASGEVEIRKAHEDPHYQHLIGQFKKPDIGMLVVIRDLVAELFNQVIDATNTVFVGDTLPDQQAAEGFGITFIDAHKIHAMTLDMSLATLVGPIMQPLTQSL